MSNDTITRLRQHRIILTATQGRTGTQLLTNLLNLVPGVHAEHEPAPPIDNVWWRLRDNPRLAKTWLSRYKLPAILKTIQNSPDSSVYAETSHMLCKGFFEPLLDLGIVFDLVVLSRDPRQIATSMYYLNDIPERTKTGRRWYPMSDDQGVLAPLPISHDGLSDYQMCYWYVLEMELLKLLYYKNWTEVGQRVVRVDLNDLLSKTRFKTFLRALDLPDPPLQSWHDYKIMTMTRYNSKPGRKSFMRSKGLAQFVLYDVEKQEESVSKLMKYEEIQDMIR